MPTNEERREVAARLREYTGDMFTISTCLRFALFGDYPSYLRYTDEKVLHVLADLIEPEERTCRTVLDKYGNYTCGVCGEVLLSGWADPFEAIPLECFKYCFNCGAKVVGE